MKVDWIDEDRTGSVYQSSAYGQAAVLSSGSRWEVLGSEDGSWRLPLSIAAVGASGIEDAASPYGYAGIHADPDLAPEVTAAAWSATVEALRDRGLVAAFLRFAPYRHGVEKRSTLEGLDLVELSETIVIDLGQESDMWAAMHGRSRTAVRKAERGGLTVRVSDDPAGDLRAGGGFRRVYEEAMRRVGASSVHLHGDEYYARLSSASDVEMRLMEVVDAHGEVVAATLLFVDREAVHYHLSGSLPEGARNGANNLMIWEAMKWAAQEGHRRFHLGGGTSRGDGLYRFKASFGGESLPFLSGRVILRPQEYERLLRERARELSVDEAALRTVSFFPAYRATVAR